MIRHSYSSLKQLVTNDKAILLKFKAARNKFRAIFNRKREQYFKLEKDNLVNSVE